MITAFGKFLRDLRHRHAELLKDMAGKLEVSSAFLSSVETGKKSIPVSWLKSLCSLYQLNEEQKKKLAEAIDQSQKSATIDLSTQSNQRRSVAVALARQFDSLSDEQVRLIKNAMNTALKKNKED